MHTQRLTTRRDELRRMGTGLGMVALPGLLKAATNPLATRAPHFRPRAKQIIHIYLNGGPSQVDTWDPKPELTRQAGQRLPAGNLTTERETGVALASPFKFHQHGESGLWCSTVFQKTASQHADKICVVRSMYANTPNHEQSMRLMNTGDERLSRPSYGSWVLYGLGTENQNLPGYMVLCPGKPVVGPQLWSNSFLPGIFQGTHINHSNLDPKKVIRHINNSYITRISQRDQLDLLKRMNQIHLEKRGGRDNPLEARIESLEMAYRMQTEAQEVFDLGKETKETRSSYGPGQFADACLAARRLVESGVRMVQIYYGDGQPWDDHTNIKAHAEKAKHVDQPIAALLKDLKARDLLKDTLIIWGGEFGRTPVAENGSGRDHNHHGFTMWLAGGGVKGGMTYGSSDEFGFAAVENKVHVHDLHATILHLMGLDHEKLTFRYSGRDFRLTDVHGSVVKPILA